MDTRLYLDINHFAVHTTFLHAIMRFFAVDAVGLFAVLVLLAWWYARSTRNAWRAVAAAVWAGIATVAAVGVNQLVIHAVKRVRPYWSLHHVEVLIAKGHDYTFPSDHATASGAAAMGLWIAARYGGKALRRFATWASVLAIVVAFARVYVGAHYPGDVVAGLVLGALVAEVGWLIVKYPLTEFVRFISRRSLLRPLVLSRR